MRGRVGTLPDIVTKAACPGHYVPHLAERRAVETQEKLVHSRLGDTFPKCPIVSQENGVSICAIVSELYVAGNRGRYSYADFSLVIRDCRQLGSNRKETPYTRKKVPITVPDGRGIWPATR